MSRHRCMLFAAGLLTVALAGVAAPASAVDPKPGGRKAPLSEATDPPKPPRPTGSHAARVSAIVAKANPKLMEVVVTRRGKGKGPTFQIIKTPTLAKARATVDGVLDRSDVLAVEMNQPIKTTDLSDPLYIHQWALDANHLDIRTVRRATAQDTRKPIVAVVDTGVKHDHPDMSGRIMFGYNAFNGATGNTYDGCGHGTHVAGIIAANTNNGGIVGMARTASILPVKVFDSSCHGTTALAARGIVWAAQRAHVINMSFGSYTHSDAMAQAVSYARSRGRVLVAAVGNDHSGGYDDVDPPMYPAGYSQVIGVAALTPSYYYDASSTAYFSNRGYTVDVAAPGVSIMSTMPVSSYLGCGSNYCRLQGTSMAAPHVSALAALAIAHCGWNANTVMDRIQRRTYWYPYKYVDDGYGAIKPKSVLSCI